MEFSIYTWKPSKILIYDFIFFMIMIYILMFQDDFPGLIPLINRYMDNVDIDVDTRCTILQYLNLISKRASG